MRFGPRQHCWAMPSRAAFRMYLADFPRFLPRQHLRTDLRRRLNGMAPMPAFQRSGNGNDRFPHQFLEIFKEHMAVAFVGATPPCLTTRARAATRLSALLVYAPGCRRRTSGARAATTQAATCTACTSLLPPTRRTTAGLTSGEALSTHSRMIRDTEMSIFPQTFLSHHRHMLILSQSALEKAAGREQGRHPMTNLQ